ncbi:Hsp20/alpha crystallin family protein [Deinococcus apachensis]|uniref:Hsp20/alpha crystallin family protein n=1 Tax=Deinococcus apachensis TaxID=309886 RepID=UPI000381B008|nr:Hsp20/alpha crystallin family protein [Deinococcus apachensis]
MALVRTPNNGMTTWSSDLMPTPSSLWPALDCFIGELASPTLAGTRFLLDMYETESHVVIDVAVPGVKPEDLDVQVEGLTLSIRGRYSPSNADGKRYWVKTLPSGEFQCSVTLPVKVETDQVDASLESGVLHLHLPKAAEVRTRKIEIKRANSAKALS